MSPIVSGKHRPVLAFVGMGSNLGDRLRALRTAVVALNQMQGVKVGSASPIYETEAHTKPGQDSQPDHLNAVVQVSTSLSADDFLRRLIELEDRAGRRREVPNWSPRPLDLDLLIYGEVEIDAEELTVPHPRMSERRFVLQPLADLVHNLIVPGADGATVSDLLERCPDTKCVERTGLFLIDES